MMYNAKVYEIVGNKNFKCNSLSKAMKSDNPVRIELHNLVEDSKLTVLISYKKTYMIFDKKDVMSFDWTKKQANEWLVSSIIELGCKVV